MAAPRAQAPGSRPRPQSTARKAPARKAPAQKAPLGKAPVRKAPARQPTAKKPAPRTAAGRRPAPARRTAPTRARTPGATLRWWHRLAVVGGATLTLIGVLAVTARPPTEASQVPAPAATSPAESTAATLADAAARYRAALTEAESLDAQAQQARDAGAAAMAVVTAGRAAVGVHAAAAYRRSPDERWPLGQLSLHSPGSTTDVLHAQGLAEQLAEQQDASVGRAAVAAVQAAQHTDTAEAADAAAGQARSRAADVLVEVRRIVADLDPTVSAQWAALSTSAAAAADQQARNAAALAGWQGYLGQLAAAGITPPPAATLTDPGALPTGLAALRDATGAPVPGTATTYAAGGTLTVLPAEAVAAVSAAFAQLGKPYLVGQRGPDGYDCGGLTATAWAQGGIGLPADLPGQWAQGTPVPAGQLQVGDLVFSTDPRSGLDDVGLYLGGTSVLSASADQWQVAVRELADLSTAVRVTVPPATPTPVPVTGPVAATCSAPLPTPGSSPGPVTGAWSGWANGQIPRDELCSTGDGHRLRCDAAAAYRAMSAAYAQAFGTPLCITDSYRSLAAQVDVRNRKPGITAVPGTSNHGWALAVDLCGGINVFGTAQTAWMQLNAGHYGWLQPDWAQAGGQNPEPWHWEYGVLS